MRTLLGNDVKFNLSSVNPFIGITDIKVYTIDANGKRLVTHSYVGNVISFDLTADKQILGKLRIDMSYKVNGLNKRLISGNIIEFVDNLENTDSIYSVCNVQFNNLKTVVTYG